MDNDYETMDLDEWDSSLTQKLMVSSMVYWGKNGSFSAEIRRGMPVFSKDGMEIGKVAAVILKRTHNAAMQILLSRLPNIEGYLLVDVDLITEIDQEKIVLSISEEVLQSLPRWRTT
jgi:sporulation protein YlmC with PRC-barrel domain